jgi:hypothetical protein
MSPIIFGEKGVLLISFEKKERTHPEFMNVSLSLGVFNIIIK